MAMHRWWLNDFHGGIWLVVRDRWDGAVEIPQGAVAISSEAARSVDEWLSTSWAVLGDATVLAEIAAALGEDASWQTDELATVRLKRAVREALRRGRLVALRQTLPPPAGAIGEKEEDTRPAGPAPRDEKTWIEIALVDDDDPPRPVPYKRYRVELASGETREGMLDQHGRAMLRGIDPGTCQVMFPDVDAREWRRV